MERDLVFRLAVAIIKTTTNPWITVISRFRVRNGMEEAVRQAFLARPRLVETQAGFCGLEVLTDASDPSVFLLLTRWTSEAAFRVWHRSDAHHHAHELIPDGLKLDASFTSILVGERVEDPGGVVHFSDALEGQTVALSQWIADSDAVFAFLLAQDGTIRARNRAADRVLEIASASVDLKIWDFLVCSDAEAFRRRLMAQETPQERCFLLNLVSAQQQQVTVEVGWIPCAGGVLLLGAIEQKHVASLQIELQRLANDMSVIVRERARKNKELEQANQTIERLARTDALTGLANRRALDEAFPREIARAERQQQDLTVILADLDHFKSINDDYGHVVGDQVLAETAAVFASELRPYDLAARYGGEEFAILLPGTPLDEGVAIAERVRNDVASLKIPGFTKQITVSLGVARWLTGETPEVFIARADAALYSAKLSGRNRVQAELPPPDGLQDAK